MPTWSLVGDPLLLLVLFAEGIIHAVVAATTKNMCQISDVHLFWRFHLLVLMVFRLIRQSASQTPCLSVLSCCVLLVQSSFSGLISVVGFERWLSGIFLVLDLKRSS